MAVQVSNFLGGRNVKKLCAKSCYFYAETIKFGLILTHFELLGGRQEKNFGVQMPSVAQPLLISV